MQTVIIAGGRGIRLHDVTKDIIPKPMAKINGKPILEYIFQTIPKISDEVILVVGHKGEKIREYFKDEYNGIKIKYVEQKEALGPAHALLQAKDHLNDGLFLILNGDNFYNPKDLEKLIIDKPAILVRNSKHPEKFGACVVDDNNTLLKILEKVENPPTNLVNIGAYLLDKDIFNEPMVKVADGSYNLAEQIGNWAEKREIKTIEADFWQSINNKEEFEEAKTQNGFFKNIISHINGS